MKQYIVKCECGGTKQVASKATILRRYKDIIDVDCKYCGQNINDALFYFCNKKSYYHGIHIGMKMYGKVCFDCVKNKVKNKFNV